jgi:hypothetical protein
VLEEVIGDRMDVQPARDRLQLIGLGIAGKGKTSERPELGTCLAIPADAPQLRRIFADTDFHKGGWWQALKQAPAGIVPIVKKVKINGSAQTVRADRPGRLRGGDALAPQPRQTRTSRARPAPSFEAASDQARGGAAVRRAWIN